MKCACSLNILWFAWQKRLHKISIVTAVLYAQWCAAMYCVIFKTKGTCTLRIHSLVRPLTLFGSFERHASAECIFIGCWIATFGVLLNQKQVFSYSWDGKPSALNAMHCNAKKRFSTSSQQHKFQMRKHTDRLHSQESPHDFYDLITMQETFWIRQHTLNKSIFLLDFHRVHFRKSNSYDIIDGTQ